MVGNDWDEVLESEFAKPYFKNLMQFLEAEYQTKDITPPQELIFAALKLTPFAKVKVVILGQDPYPEKGVANGLAFSANNQATTPESLKNIYKALKNDLQIERWKNELDDWAKQGVLLLNTVLTTEVGKPLSHNQKGWEILTDEIIKKLNINKNGIVFILLGNKAKGKRRLVDEHNFAIESSHPSPLSAYRGFLESRIFSKTNQLLKKEQKINW